MQLVISCDLTSNLKATEGSFEASTKKQLHIYKSLYNKKKSLDHVD